MGCKRNFLILLVILCLREGLAMEDGDSNNLELLDTLVLDIVKNRYQESHHENMLYNMSLPPNFSGMEVSLVKLHSVTFWSSGANFSHLNIPPRIATIPYVRKLAIVYQDLGNWSSMYYELPGYSLVAPVISFAVYNATNASTLGDSKLNIITMGDAIRFQFPLETIKDKNATFKCVKFHHGGTIELEDMIRPNICTTLAPGHFSIAIPLLPKKEKFWKWWWWATGVAAGVGLIGVITASIVVFKLRRRKKLREMEREADKGNPFNTIWIDSSKMPSSPMKRTKPVLADVHGEINT